AVAQVNLQAAASRLDSGRQRVLEVLQRTTGFTEGDDPALWEKQYSDYNGWVTPTRIKPTISLAYSEAEGRYTNPVQSTTVLYSMPPHNCCAAGTTVMTLGGPMPIEKIKFGDRVLTQDVGTGELVFSAVQATTLMPTTPLVKLVAGDSAIVATPGHPFWVL